MPRKKKTEEDKVEDTVKEEVEEFPDTDIAIDVFAAPTNAEKLKNKAEDIIENIKDKIKSVGEDIQEKVERLKENKGKKKKEPKDTSKIEELKEKAKKLAEKIDEKEDKIQEFKEGLKEIEKEKSSKKARRSAKTLFPLDDYVKYSSHLGTKAVTPNMRQFVYKRRADGLAVLNTNSIDEKLKEAVEFFKDFNPEDTFLVCKREAGWKAAEKFGEVTGIKVFTKKYPAGVITNTQLTDFFETELVIICDPWLDKNALNDANRVKKPVIGLCDTNNLTKGITKIIPCNNKAAKSLGLILYLLAREYLKARGQEKESKKLKLEDFTGEEIQEKVEDVEKGAKEGV